MQSSGSWEVNENKSSFSHVFNSFQFLFVEPDTAGSVSLVLTQNLAVLVLPP